MKHLWAMWTALWDRREPVTAMALVRILVGLVLVVDILASFSVSDYAYSVTRGYGNPHDGWGRVLLGDDPGPALVIVSLACAIGILVGALTPVACVGYALVGAQLAYIAPMADQGVFPMLRIACFLLAFGRAGNQWSIDAAVMRTLGRPLSTVAPAWPRYLLMVQLVWIYLSGGMNKSSPAWGPHGGFRAIENIVSDPHLGRFTPGWIASFVPLARMATAATIVFELCAPVYLVAYYFADTTGDSKLRRAFTWLRVRWVWIALGLCFHLGIAVTLRIAAFPWGMLALYPVLLRPSEVARLTRTAGTGDHTHTPTSMKQQMT